jgi:hypothetical protein
VLDRPAFILGAMKKLTTSKDYAKLEKQVKPHLSNTQLRDYNFKRCWDLGQDVWSHIEFTRDGFTNPEKPPCYSAISRGASMSSSVISRRTSALVSIAPAQSPCYSSISRGASMSSSVIARRTSALVSIAPAPRRSVSIPSFMQEMRRDSGVTKMSISSICN